MTIMNSMGDRSGGVIDAGLAARITLIVAMGRNRAIGRGGALLWRIPEDLRRFKRITMGHPIVMGRKTHASIGRVLPGRTHIVLTRQAAFVAPGAVIVHTLREALHRASQSPGGETIFIIGGGELYLQTLPLANRLLVTAVDDVVMDADTCFPEHSDFTPVAETGPFETAEGLRYRFQEFQRQA